MGCLVVQVGGAFCCIPYCPVKYTKHFDIYETLRCIQTKTTHVKYIRHLNVYVYVDVHVDVYVYGVDKYTVYIYLVYIYDQSWTFIQILDDMLLCNTLDCQWMTCFYRIHLNDIHPDIR